MATSLDTTTGNALLKEYYLDQVVQNMAYRDNPLLALIKKKSNVGGSLYPVPVITDTNMNTSNIFATSQSNQAPASMTRFNVTRAKYFNVATITDELMLACQGDENAFLDETKVLVDAAILSTSNQMAGGLYRSGTGSIGSISTIGTVATGVIQLVNPSDIGGFGVNQVLQCTSTSTDGSSVLAAVGYVIAVNRANGQLTVSTTSGGLAANPASWAAGLYLLPAGNSNAGFVGLAGWFPATAPTSTAFFGVDRSTDPVRLAGVRYDGSSLPVPEAFIKAAALTAREGGAPDMGLCTYETFAELENGLGAKVQYVDLEGPAQIGFRGIRLTAGVKAMEIVPDRNCIAATTFLITKSSIKLIHLQDSVPCIQRSGDGLMMLRSANAAASELRVAAYGQLACEAPVRNCNVTVAV